MPCCGGGHGGPKALLPPPPRALVGSAGADGSDALLNLSVLTVLSTHGSLAAPEDLHLGVRLDILEDEDDMLGLAMNAAAQQHHHLHHHHGGAAGNGPNANLAMLAHQLQEALETLVERAVATSEWLGLRRRRSPPDNPTGSGPGG
ncbi:hypothetical protein TSOC_001273 [Tetrabaena socialis]|uniref:Uncharacterized protein n=1 Tax=Tetrabaena socialis TaxID=47790 RepID=A0A2J8AH47_9CHLO|nr:hypothetical protein TSOC_001273 [Tetrabaena socialis]|eukprot:PNH11844.1 hypothetical protein TSOC_001273 [Tetrabaena socialis]